MKLPVGNHTVSYPTQSNEDIKSLKRLFDELFLKSGLVPFSRKINLLKDLSLRNQAMQELMPKKLVNKLDKVRDIRNRFAHYPVTFTPVGNPPNQELSVSLVCTDKELILNNKFFDKYNELFSSVRLEMEEMLKCLKQESGKT